MKSTLPSPETASIPSYSGLEVVEITFSRRQLYRAIIAKDSRGMLHVRRDRWDLSEYDHVGKGYWTQDDRGATLTDTLKIARELALEKIRETADGYNEEEHRTSSGGADGG